VAVVKPSDLVPDDVARSLKSGPGGGLFSSSLGIQVGGVSPESITDDAAPGDAAPALTASREPMNKGKRSVVMISAAVFVALALLVINTRISDANFDKKGSHTTPIDGLTIFAVFFVAAFAIERLLEPLAALLIPKQDVSDDLSTSMGAAKDATIDFYKAQAAHAQAGHRLAAANDSATMAGSAMPDGSIGEQANPQQEQSQAAEAAKTAAAQQMRAATENMAAKHDTAQEMLDKAATAKAAYQDREYTRTVAFWAVATAVAMLGSASLHLYFLKAVGMSSSSRWLEILATGLIIGAGTKPLNDLTTKLSAQNGLASDATT
jgi:hypothetical protein